MSVEREEFEALVQRVTQLERRHDAAMEIFAAEIVGLRTYLDEHFAKVDERFDGLDKSMALLTGEVGEVKATQTEHGGLLRRIARQLGVDTNGGDT